MNSNLSPPVEGYSLDEARRVFIGVTRRAARVWSLLEALRSLEILVDAGQALHDVSTRIYYSSAYDAAERFETLEDFQEVLLEDDFSGIPKRERNGTSCYVLRPVLGELGIFRHYANGRMEPLALGDSLGHFCKPLQEAADVQASGELEALQGLGPCEGLAPQELVMLVKAYTSRALRYVHALRQLRTSLHYVMHEGYEERLVSQLVFCDEGLFSGLREVFDLTQLAGYTPAAKAYALPGSDALNLVRGLPADKEAFFADLAR